MPRSDSLRTERRSLGAVDVRVGPSRPGSAKETLDSCGGLLVLLLLPCAVCRGMPGLYGAPNGREKEMRLRRMSQALLVGGFALLPAMAFGGLPGRLDDDFSTVDQSQANNQACIVIDFDEFAVFGEVQATSGDCLVTIEYGTDTPHQGSGTSLKGTKTTGNAKVSQQIFTDVFITVEDGPGLGVCGPANTFAGFAEPEKCKATASMKGTSVPPTTTTDPPDTVQSSRVNLSCQLGVNFANVDTAVASGIQPPTSAQADFVIAAFAARKDVTIKGKNDDLKIKQKGIPDTATPPAVVFCDE